MKFATMRLGQSSVSEIKKIDNLEHGAHFPAHEFETRCKQVPLAFAEGDYVLLFLGSDNNKGNPTDWKQGFRAIGRVSSLNRGPSRNDDSTIGVEVGFIFNESIQKIDFLRESPFAYYWFSDMPLFSLSDHSNQTVRLIEHKGLQSLPALFAAVSQLKTDFQPEVLRVYPELESLFNFTPPNPKSEVLPAVDIGVLNTDASSANLSRQRIFFGAPGTGKSYKLSSEAERYFSGLDNFGQKRVNRVTFHPEYSFFHFIGTYRPVVSELDRSISYGFVPGPFSHVLVSALNNPDSDYLLIIEEINRANTAAVFGELFQLLDRDNSGVSEYPTSVSSEFWGFLQSELTPYGRSHLNQITDRTGLDGIVDPGQQIALPSNLYIWATMNSADQGVFPMDTAFKRRWSFEYVGIDEGQSQCDWNEERRLINKRLLEAANVPEDKLIGPFFLTTRAFSGTKSRVMGADFKRDFESVLMYIYEDAARYHRGEIFDTKMLGEYATLGAVLDGWRRFDFGIFAGVDGWGPGGFRNSMSDAASTDASGG